MPSILLYVRIPGKQMNKVYRANKTSEQKMIPSLKIMQSLCSGRGTPWDVRPPNPRKLEERSRRRSGTKVIQATHQCNKSFAQDRHPTIYYSCRVRQDLFLTIHRSQHEHVVDQNCAQLNLSKPLLRSASRAKRDQSQAHGSNEL